MEAMRMGTLPIIAPTGGLKDTVEDDVTCFWCDSEMTCEAELDAQSTESLVRALKRAAKTPPQKMSEMRKAAMVAASEFSWTNSAMQYEVVFNDLGAVNVLSKSGNSYVTLENDEQIC
jgi:glycogen synthase